MKVFVTGGGGFIGGHVVAALVSVGHEVTALVRRTRPAAAVRLVHGDVCEPATYFKALAGQDIAIHLAADYQIGPRDRAAMYRANVTGTCALVDAARATGVGRILYVSSTAALGATPEGGGDEGQRHDGQFRSFYEETKHIAHGLVEARIAGGAPVVIAIPGGVFGSGDTSVLAQTLRDAARGKLPVQVATRSRFQLCAVERVAAGLVTLATDGRLGDSYLLTGIDTSMPELLARVAAVTGRPPIRAIEPARLRLAARCADALRRLGLSLPLSSEALRVMDGSRYVYRSDKARHQLGWDAGEVEADLERYIASLARG